MLGIIANYCCVISRNSIIKQSVSLDDIWRKIREHYGFQSTGSHFLELANITLLPNERHEDLYQRIMAFFEDNLLTANGNLTHHGESIDTDEDLSVPHSWEHYCGTVAENYTPRVTPAGKAKIRPRVTQ